MNINSVLKSEGIEIKSKLATSQVNKIATIISQNWEKFFKGGKQHKLPG